MPEPSIDAHCEQYSTSCESGPSEDAFPANWRLLVLSVVALIYALLAGLRTVVEYDLGWQLATGRWIAQHHQIPFTDVFSFTAQGQPWTYPVGSGLIFYATYLLGGYSLLSWMGAAACAGTVALLLRRGSALTAGIAILAIPRIAARTSPRADMFTIVLFAAFLTILWQQHETGRARLWLLPALMLVWVNLHLGLASGLALLGGYVLVESLEMLWPERRKTAMEHLRRAWPWFIATFAATLVNPWGWRIHSSLLGFMQPMATHQSQPQLIAEWAPAKIDWTTIAAGLSLRNPDTFLLLLLVVAIAVPVALFRRQPGAAVLLSGAAYLGIRHVRLQALFSVIVVIIAGSVLTSAFGNLREWVRDARIRFMLAVGACCMIAALVCFWSIDLITDRTHLGSTDLSSFGTGLSWWFPENAAAFIEREKLPGQIFNSYNEGGYIAWRLGPNYLDYVDGRGDPFGAELVSRSTLLAGSLPDSEEWQQESDRYGINTIIVPLGRYDALQFFPVLRQFCASDTWRPVYLDEVSAVFVRRSPATESLIQRLQINCDTAPIPAVAPTSSGSKAFNQWANAAALLAVLGRNSEAYAATTRALAIFPDSAYVHFTRAGLLEQGGNLHEAEQQYLSSAMLEPHAVSWAKLAKLYEQEGRYNEAATAWQHVADLSADSHLALLSLGYDEIGARRTQEALNAFDRAQTSLQKQSAMGNEADDSFYANLARGRAIAWRDSGDFRRAIPFAEEAARFAPGSSDVWLELAELYRHEGRSDDAQRAGGRAEALSNRTSSSDAK